MSDRPTCATAWASECKSPSNSIYFYADDRRMKLRDSEEAKKSANGSDVGRCQDFVERITLEVLSKCDSEHRALPREVMLTCILCAFKGWVASPEAQAITGLMPDVAASYLDDRMEKFIAKFQPSVERAYQAWTDASRVNGSVVAN